MKKALAAGVAMAMALSMASMGAMAEDNAVDVNVIAAQYGQNTADWWAQFVKDFNAANPGINLNVEVVSWNDIYTVVKYSLQGTTQGRYLTGGVPPVRFSM